MYTNGLLPRIGDRVLRKVNPGCSTEIDGLIGVVKHVREFLPDKVNLEFPEPTGLDREGCKPGYGWRADVRQPFWEFVSRAEIDLPEGGDWE